MHFLVNLDIDDLDKAIRFYGSVFGLKVGRRFGNFGVEMLGGQLPFTCSSNCPVPPSRIQLCSDGTTSAIGLRCTLIS